MRALSPLLLLAALALTPVGAAASFELGAERILERALDPGSEAVFEMPVIVNQDGFLYAKLLPTEGNAANDGFRANGSISEDRGWIVRFAFVDASGRQEMGAFVDSSATQPVAVRRGEPVTLVATVRIPADAAIGGPKQAIYVALAYRSPAAGPGSASGASMDEARALTLLMTNALLPPAAPVETDAPAEESTEEPPAVPPVAPLESTTGSVTNVHVQPLPTWFLVGVLVIGGALVVALAFVGAALHALRPRAAPALAAARQVPVRTEIEEPPQPARVLE